MPARIDRVAERRWTYPGERCTNRSYRVYYASGKRVQYAANKSLPYSIVRFITEADTAQVTYREACIGGKDYTVKETVYKRTEPEQDAKPTATRPQPDRPYCVTFTTQRRRVETNWEFLALAPNKQAAIDQAREKWYEKNEAHMFHCEAWRVSKANIPEDREPFTFKAISAGGVTWGGR